MTPSVFRASLVLSIAARRFLLLLPVAGVASARFRTIEPDENSQEITLENFGAATPPRPSIAGSIRAAYRSARSLWCASLGGFWRAR